ncbi:hypothetical protein LTR53_018239, partial [Teratosphaeriaceae sp. CCFEE 6253]
MKADGSEERVAVLGEDWREVDPGCLPRTLEEMRAGRAASGAVSQVPAIVEQQEDTPGQSLEDTLDQMFQEAEAEGTPAHQQEAARGVQQGPPRSVELSQYAVPDEQQRVAELRPSNVHAQAMAPTASRNREYQGRRIAALRRELHRMRNGIERVITGLRDLGEPVPEHAEATTRLSALGSTLDAIDGRPSQGDSDLAVRGVDVPTGSTG